MKFLAKFKSLNYSDKIFYIFTFSAIGFISFAVIFLAFYVAFSFKNININFIIDQYIDFGDFFKVLFFIKNRNPYLDARAINAIANYPPLAYLILYPFSLIAGNAGAEKLIYSARGLVSLSIFFLITLTCIIILILKITKNLPKNKKILILISVLVSYPFLFLLDRGNVNIVSLICLLFFICYHKSEKKILRELSLLFLAAAILVKLYPAVFLIILIRDKRMIDLVKSGIYSIALFFLPFLFFKGGLNNLGYFLDDLNIFINHSFDCEQEVSITFLIKSIGGLFNINTNTVNTLSFIIPFIILFFALIGSLFIKDTWKAYILLGLICAVIPMVSFIYSMIFIIPGIIEFLMSEKNKKEFYYIGFMVFLLYFSFINHPVNSFAAFIFILLLIIEGLICLIKLIKKRELIPFIKTVFKGFINNGEPESKNNYVLEGKNV